jgi:hypothetical protein
MMGIHHRGFCFESIILASLQRFVIYPTESQPICLFVAWRSATVAQLAGRSVWFGRIKENNIDQATQ